MKWAHARVSVVGEPACSQKMTPPRYQEVNSPDIPEVTDDDGTSVRIVCGTFWGKKGPVDGIATDPIYIDVTVPPGKRKMLPVETTRHAFAYVFAGAGKFCNASEPLAVPTESVGWLDTKPPSEADNRSLVLLIGVMRRWCRRATMGCAFCLFGEAA